MKGPAKAGPSFFSWGRICPAQDSPRPILPSMRFSIRHNYRWLGEMWKRVWFGEDEGIVRRLFYFLFIAIMVPIMLIGLPFALWELWRRRKSRSSDS